MLRHAGTLADVFNDDAWVGVAHWQGTHKKQAATSKEEDGSGWVEQHAEPPLRRSGEVFPGIGPSDRAGSDQR